MRATRQILAVVLIVINITLMIVFHRHSAFVDMCGEPKDDHLIRINNQHRKKANERIWSDKETSNATSALRDVQPRGRRPPLSEIIDSYGNITSDPQFLLDFVISGFGKCGTSTLMHQFANHPQMAIFREEVWLLMGFQPHNLVKKLYEELPEGNHYIRGYKSPVDLTKTHIVAYYRTLFPRTKLVVGIRHPIRWFESLYNFRIQNLPRNAQLPHPNLLVGPCSREKRNTCPMKGNFGRYLLRLGKQNKHNSTMKDAAAQNLSHSFHRRMHFDYRQEPYTPNPVFLYDLAQLSDASPTRQALFYRDLEVYLGLTTPLPPPVAFRPGKQHDDETQKHKDGLKIDICDEDYHPIRDYIMSYTRPSGTWLREVFVHHEDVTVSSIEHLQDILATWQYDPCDANEI